MTCGALVVKVRGRSTGVTSLAVLVHPPIARYKDRYRPVYFIRRMLIIHESKARKNELSRFQVIGTKPVISAWKLADANTNNTKTIVYRTH